MHNIGSTMSLVSISRFIIMAIVTLTLAGCVSDPNNLNKKTGLTPVSNYSSELT